MPVLHIRAVQVAVYSGIDHKEQPPRRALSWSAAHKDGFTAEYQHEDRESKVW